MTAVVLAGAAVGTPAGEPPEPLVDMIAERLRVLGQPLRIHILTSLERHGETSVQALADRLDATQQNVSRHLGLLLRAGLVRRRRAGRVVFYRLADDAASALIQAARSHVLRSLKRPRPDR